MKNAKGANIYACATDKATIPIEPTPEAPTVITKEAKFDSPKGSFIWNRGVIANDGEIQPGQVAVEENGSLGALASPGSFADCFMLKLLDAGEITGQGSFYKHDLSRATVELRRNAKKYDSVVYNGNSQLFDVVVFIGGSSYFSDRNFTVTYRNAAGKAIQEKQVKNA